MTTETPRKHRLFTAVMIVVAILSIPFVLLGVYSATHDRR